MDSNLIMDGDGNPAEEDFPNTKDPYPIPSYLLNLAPLRTEPLISPANNHGDLEIQDTVMTGVDIPPSDDLLAELTDGTWMLPTSPTLLTNHAPESESCIAYSSSVPSTRTRLPHIRKITSSPNLYAFTGREREEYAEKFLKHRAASEESQCSSGQNSMNQVDVSGLKDALLSAGMGR